jgi:hypothetical protein
MSSSHLSDNVSKTWPTHLWNICANGPFICFTSFVCPCVQYAHITHIVEKATNPHRSQIQDALCFSLYCCVGGKCNMTLDT